MGSGRLKNCGLFVEIDLPIASSVNIKRKMDFMKKNACLLSAITNPIIFLADSLVVILLNHTDYQHQSIWTDGVLSQWFYTFFTPFFVLTMLSTWYLYVDESKSNSDGNADSTPTSKIEKINGRKSANIEGKKKSAKPG